MTHIKIDKYRLKKANFAAFLCYKNKNSIVFLPALYSFLLLLLHSYFSLQPYILLNFFVPISLLRANFLSQQTCGGDLNCDVTSLTRAVKFSGRQRRAISSFIPDDEGSDANILYYQTHKTRDFRLQLRYK
jgi:hypothetical protein